MDTNARAVRMFAAYSAGQAARRLRDAGMSHDGICAPHESGAYQWAQATGFYDDKAERSAFVMGFTHA